MPTVIWTQRSNISTSWLPPGNSILGGVRSIIAVNGRTVTVQAPFRIGLGSPESLPGGRATYRIQPCARVLVEIARAWTYRKTAGVYPPGPGAVLFGSGRFLPTDPGARQGGDFWGWAVFLPDARRTTHGK